MPSSDPVGLVEYLAKSLARYPDDVSVQPVLGTASLVLELRVNPEDLGTVIGKGGRIAKAMRNLLTSISVKEIEVEKDKFEKFSKIILEIVED